MKTPWTIRLALWLIRRNQAYAATVVVVRTELLASARAAIAEAGRVGAEASGEYKRAQALRMLLNQHPEARERDCALAIEVALCSV